jgi:hypothetical protein
MSAIQRQEVPQANIVDQKKKIEPEVAENVIRREVSIPEVLSQKERDDVEVSEVRTKVKRPSITAGLKTNSDTPATATINKTEEPEVTVIVEEKKPTIQRRSRTSLLGEAIKTIDVSEQSAAVQVQNEPMVQEKPVQSQAARDAYVQLADFIHQNLTQGTETEMVTLQLTFASTTGKIPRDVFAETIQAPFEDLYGNIRAVAEEKGYKNLLTTKGQSYCQKIYNGLNPNKPKRTKK